MIRPHGKRFKMSAAGKSVRRRLNESNVEPEVVFLHPETVEAETRNAVSETRPDGSDNTRTPPGEPATEAIDLEMEHYMVDYLPKDIFVPFKEGHLLDPTYTDGRGWRAR